MTTFPAIRTEGGLLGPDLLDEALTASLSGQKPADFGLKGKSLTDEIAAAFADAKALWGVWQRRLQKLTDDDPATTLTRDAWVIPFLGLLGYELKFNAKAFEVDGLSFAVSHRADEAADAPPVHVVGARQDLGRLMPSGRPRYAPHTLIQEYLNRTEHLWGVVTNGLTLRLLRDCTFVRRQAYVEFDLQQIVAEQRFPDFAVLYRLAHRSRLPRGQADAGDCLLEQYYHHSVEQGGRVRDHLRDGVELAIVTLANGFLHHHKNANQLATLSADDLYRQLLRLVYRFLFLMVSEDRGLLGTSKTYREHYSLARLRKFADRRVAYTDDPDLWHTLRVLWQAFSRDDQPFAEYLDVPVLNGDLFTKTDLDDCLISNRELLTALWHLSWYVEKKGAPPRRVNYAALDVEELGSVYESLLEFHPAIDRDERGRPTFALIAGSERKTTGSFYTPPELVAELIRSALDPVIAERLARPEKEREQALLSLKVCDMACGSGHMLLAAARRIGRALAQVRTGADEPSPAELRTAIRDVIAHCIYGVDKNPLAVDLCRVALWIESHTADKPLTFLDHRIRHGDSLVGVFDLDVLRDGIPDEAFTPLEGDDKTAARAAAKANKDERKGRLGLFDQLQIGLDGFSRNARAVDAIADDSPANIRAKRALYEEGKREINWRRQKGACDLWTAAFFQPLTSASHSITSRHVAEQLQGMQLLQPVSAASDVISQRQAFFHWQLEFPEVFAAGGFDVVLSNPPWERVKLQEQEFFAARDARIATAANKAARAKLIKALPTENPELNREYLEAQHAASAASLFLRHSGRYPLGGRGDINTYAVFAELASLAPNPSGRAGIILPKGIATDDTTKYFFGSLVKAGRLLELIGFENEDFIFPAVDHRVTFCTLTIGGSGIKGAKARIGFYIRKFSQLNDDARFFTLTNDEFALLNPNTGNCPIFRGQADAELTKAIYRRVPVLWRAATDDRPEENPWRLSFKTLFHMANDSHHFRTAAELLADGYRLDGNVFVSAYDRYLPLYEAKMLHHFDHRFSTYENATEKQLNVGILPQPTPEQKRDPNFVVQPRYWVREEIVESAIPQYPEPLALAVKAEDDDSIRRVLCWWAAGHLLNRVDKSLAGPWLDRALKYTPDKNVAKWFGDGTPEDHATALERDYPLTDEDVAAIEKQLKAPGTLASVLLTRFGPKWFIGWRDVCRSNDERTLIASPCPMAAIGHKFQLIVSQLSASLRAAMLANCSAFVTDYCARQKLGGTSFSYFVIRQLPILTPSDLSSQCKWSLTSSVCDWMKQRVLELVYTALDLTSLARECGNDRPPFAWDEERRFQLRCELDAAYFHLYLPAEANGEWRMADRETAEQLEALKRHFPTPRDAVAYVLDTFPQVRKKDEEAHGSYRTKERILREYDEMQAAQAKASN